MNDVYNLPDSVPLEEDENDSILVRNVLILLAVFVTVLTGLCYLLSNSSGSVVHTATDNIFLLMTKETKDLISFSAYDQKTEKFAARFEKAPWLKRIPSSNHVAISPDGCILAACLKNQYMLITVNLKTGKTISEKELKCEHPSFTKKNDLIYVQKNSEKEWKIVFESIMTGKKEFTSKDQVHSPQYSDAHKKIFYISDDLKRIYSYDPEDESEPVVVGKEKTEIKGMLLSPNGDKISLSEDGQHHSIISAKSATLLRTLDITDLVKFAWSTDNENIYYMHGSGKNSIKSINTSDNYSTAEEILNELKENTIGMWRSY